VSAVAASAAALDAVFTALSDRTRRAILARLARGEASVMNLAEPFDMSLPGVTKHLRVLEDAGLVTRQKAGRTNWCRLRPQPLQQASKWMDGTRRFWEQQLDGLDRYLRADAQQEEKWNTRLRNRRPRATTPRFASRVRSRRRASASSAPGRTPMR
jgi:DNA-binding transcriptional ArsR family regulator